jgi:hypothetical protein
VTRWFERALRELRGEGRQPPSSISDICARGNEWIEKLKNASDAKPKGKAKATAKGKAPDPFVPEPKHANLEAALQAAKECKKCLQLKDGSKGCRACMGEHFEQVRHKGFLSRAAKDFELACMQL